MNTTLSFKVALILGSLVLLLIGFLGGQAFERVRIGHYMGWQDNYERNFFGRRGFGPPPLRAHALLGKILSIDNDKINVLDNNGTEQSILITTNTVIRRDGSSAQKSDLKTDQQVAVFGHPNGQGQIEAQLIRIFDTNAKP